MNATFDALLAVLATIGVLNLGAVVAPVKQPECPKIMMGERLAYTTYSGGTMRCTYIPNIIGLARRAV